MKKMMVLEIPLREDLTREDMTPEAIRKTATLMQQAVEKALDVLSVGERTLHLTNQITVRFVREPDSRASHGTR